MKEKELTQKEKEKIDEIFDRYKNCEYFKEKVQDVLNKSDIFELIDEDDCYWEYRDNLLDEFPDDEIIIYLEHKGYNITENEDNYLLLGEDNISQHINTALQYLTTKSYLEKEEKKKLICDYIDFWL